MTDTLSPFREYETPKPAEAPRGNVSECDLIAATTGIRIWSMKTKHSLEAILSEGFFSDMSDLRFRRNDRIELICDTDADQATHGTLVVDDADKHGKASVSLLHRYDRGQ
jgi:hypothetical protein